jgi:hypothetical protein
MQCFNVMFLKEDTDCIPNIRTHCNGGQVNVSNFRHIRFYSSQAAYFLSKSGRSGHYAG